MQRLRNIIVALLIGLLACGQALADQPRKFSLTVVDSEDGAPLPGVVVTVGKTRAVSSADGRVTINLSGTDSERKVTFSLVGYATVTKTAGELLRMGDKAVVRLTFETTTLGGVAVEAERPLPSSSAVGERINGEELASAAAESLAEVLSSVKGLSMISSGTTSSVPVIQGMSGERILIVANGVRQEGQQWNSDLGPEVDAASAGSITVLKGAESVRYGSDALGGVILVDEAPLPYGGKLFGGRLLGQYGTNGRTYSARAVAEGAFGPGRDLAYRIQGSYTNGGDRSTARYILNNTGIREYSLQAALGWQKSRYGAELNYALTGHQEGILYEAKMGNIEQLKERIENGRPLVELPFSRQIDYPRHEGIHQYLSAKGHYVSDKLGRFELRLSYQKDDQDEYHYRRMMRSEIPSVSLTLHNAQGELKWRKSYLEHWSSEAGLQGQFSKNTNLPGTGVVPLIPNYVEASGGLYFIQKYHADRGGLEAGARGDLAYLDALGIDAYSQTYGGTRTFQNFTYTLGGHYHLTPELTLVSNYGTAWRAPHVGELWSNGIDSTGSLYLKGDSTMTSEVSRKWITSLSYEHEGVTVGLEGYLTWMKGYIYKEPTGETFNVISGVYPLFRYRQTAATIHGLDGEITWQIMPWMRYHVTAGMIWAAERGTGRYLPYIPPFRLGQELTFVLPFWEKSFIELGHRYTAEQKRFDPETDLIPFAPPAYNLFGMRAGTTYRFSDQTALTLLLSIENLFNLEYKEYTNLARYYSHEAGRDIRVTLRYDF